MDGNDDLGRWRQLAARHLDVQAARARRFQTYYDGEGPIHALLNTVEREAFRAYLAESGANWSLLVVNAVAERLRVDGFRFAEGGSDRVWDIWQDNSMDADSDLVHTDALVCGSSFVLVQPSEETATGVEMTAESPFEATVLYEPGSRRRRAAGYKRFGDIEGEAPTEVLMLPDVIATWYPDGTDPEVLANPAGAVGLIELSPHPRTRGWPHSELEPCIPIQDRVCTTLFGRLVATDYSAYRQVWATGVKIPRETITAEDGSETVRAVAPYNVGANRLLANENPEGRFGAFAESNLQGYLGATEQDVKHLAAITQTPPHYLLGELVNLAAEAIKAAEAGLVGKTRRRARHLGEGWEAVGRYALQLIGHPGAIDTRSEVVWGDFETRSLAQLADALLKLRDLGVPLEELWQRYGASPQMIDRWRGMRAAEAADAAANAVAALGAPGAAYAGVLAGGGTSGQAGG